MDNKMHLLQEALCQLTVLCESYRLTHCYDIFYGFSEGDFCVLDIINQIAEYALNTVTVFFFAFINAYYFGVPV